MFFYNLNSKIYKGRSYVEDDTSLIFRYSKGIDLVLDYTISLGGNPRYLMDLSSKTGRYKEDWKYLKPRKVHCIFKRLKK